MGKVSYVSDSEETDTSSSFENMKRKKLSILKYTSGSARKKKCKFHARSELEDSGYGGHGGGGGASGRVLYQLPGILKHDRDRETSDDEEDVEPEIPYPRDRCLVGRVPRPAGAKPGRGGGVAIIVRKNVSNRVPSLQQQSSSSSTKRRTLGRLMKRAY